MSKQYNTNLTRGCFHHWSVSKGVAEFVSNWLDSEGERDYDIEGDTLKLTNKNTQVSNKMLLMGLSTKRYDDSKRGLFGCGVIQAMIVLLDRGLQVNILNNNLLWKPKFQHCDKFDSDVMVIEETHCDNKDDFTVEIIGLSEEDLMEIQERCLEFQNREVLYSTEFGDIINSVDENGEVFVGDMFVCQNKSFKYSYNFHPKGVKLNQDRQSIDNWELQKLTSNLIMATKDNKLIREAIESKMLDTSNVNTEYSWDHKTDSELNDELAKGFLKENGTKFITHDYDEHESNKQLGNPSVYVPNSKVVRAIQNSSVYKEAISEVTYTERETLHNFSERVLDEISEVLYENGLITYDQQGTDQPRTGNNHLVDLIEQLKERIYEEV